MVYKKKRKQASRTWKRGIGGDKVKMKRQKRNRTNREKKIAIETTKVREEKPNCKKQKIYQKKGGGGKWEREKQRRK